MTKRRPRPRPTAQVPQTKGWAGILERCSREPEWVVFPLRLFLGVTFCFAGLQKLADPNFFRTSSPVSIQAQLRAAEHTSPLHGLLAGLAHIAAPLGLIIALAELAIGLGVLAGVLTRVAAVGGMVLSFGLFLTVSFHARPYYTGADLAYVFAFTPLLIAGPGRHLTLQSLADELAVRYPRRIPKGGMELPRRRLLVTGALGAFGVALAGLDAALGRLAGSSKLPAKGPSLSGASSPASTTPPATTATGSPTTAPSTPKGTRIGPSADVPVGGAATFQDPASGDPAIVVQATAGHFVAFDAVCPHAGCTVEYSQQQSILFCPCHGSLFNASTGTVEQGPAASNLRRIAISRDANGQLYAE